MTVPSLVIQSLADTGEFTSDAQMIFDGLAAADKQLEWVTGDHYLQDPTDARDDVAGMVHDRVTARLGCPHNPGTQTESADLSGGRTRGDRAAFRDGAPRSFVSLNSRAGGLGTVLLAAVRAGPE
ncbi:MAG TPA: hypothetical protein QGF43_07655, partial [Acidimicrobiales bacterium]|nr:hypothetical protein [Acidimicrobiales bacterium]